jgi:hypothetical protein
VNAAWKNTPGPLAPTETASWPVGQVRLVLAEGLALSVERVGENRFLIHGRGGITADRLEGLPSKPRVRRRGQE